MAISHFTAGPSPDDAISLSAFSAFAFTTGPDNLKTVTFQRSPQETSSPDDAGAEDDDEDPSEDGDGAQKDSQGPASAQSKRGKASSAERRATHNAIERARRESLNGRFLELAGALPTMAHVKRPSKSIIVNKSLEWIYESQIREHALVKENNALRAEINEMRARLQMPALPAPAPLPSAGGGQRSAGAGSAPQQPAPVQYQSLPTSAPIYGADGCFAPSVGSQAALHSPAQFPGFAGLHAPAHVSAFSNPFEALLAIGDGGRQAGSTPSTGSDVGSEAVSIRQNGGSGSLPGGFGSPQALSTSSEAGSIPSDTSVSTPSLGDHLAGLQAAYSQQQQYATLAAVGQPAMASWSLMF